MFVKVGILRWIMFPGSEASRRAACRRIGTPEVRRAGIVGGSARSRAGTVTSGQREAGSRRTDSGDRPPMYT